MAGKNQGIPLIGPLLSRIIGTRNDRFVKRYTQRVDEINALEARVKTMTDEALRAMVGEFRQRSAKGESIETILVEAFAIAREAMDRSVGIRNVFNPDRAFDPSRLSEPMQRMYAEIRAKADAMEPAPPEGDWSGWSVPIPGWRRVEVPPEFYEAVRGVYPESRPPFRARPFDVQLIGGMVLAGGKIAEMRTGEGKTIVAPLACYLGAIQRHKVHVVTVNDYLVQRDRDWTAPYFHALGLTVGAIHPQHMQDEDEKRVMYTCDVVYGTTAEFGFDYLRDNMKRRVDEQVQRRRDFAIVDEVDSILIDEARTPLIISGPAHEGTPRYDFADKLARHLADKQKPWQAADDQVQKCMQAIKGIEGDIRQARDKASVPAMQERLKAARAELPKLEKARSANTQYYEVELERKTVNITHDGIAEAQRAAGLGSLYVGDNMDLPHLLQQALRAHVVYQRDRDYIVAPVPDQQTGRTEQAIVIVDTFTGRPMIGRQWSDGLHQAIEAKEKVPIKQETQTVATVTIQNFFKMYRKLSGMTGTADTEAQEFHDIYKLDVVAIPTNRQVVRRDFDDLMYLRAKDKWEGIVEEIKAFHDVGRPILVGTTSVEKSEQLSKMLTAAHQIKHEVLNAKQHEREAHIVENAGQVGQVMIATNMAGRGTDIKLGALSRETLLDHWLRRGIAPRTVTVDMSEEQLREQVYRKVAPKVLGAQKRDVETMPFEQLEVELLRHWVMDHTLEGDKAAGMNAEECRQALDKAGRFLLHRIRWFSTVEELGGLHVIGTERHEARRIDNQLRGRSGRQGDRGSSRFFVSLEDDLMKMFAGETQMKVLARLGMKEGDSIEHPLLSKSVERAQRKVEERNFQVRKNILEYDEVMEHQRQYFYGLRQRVLEGRDLKGLVLEYVEMSTKDAVDEYLNKDYHLTCIGEFARQKLEVPVDPVRLRGLEDFEIEKAIRDEAKAEARSMIDITLGEYIPDSESEVKVDFDAQGLIGWARTRFGVELTPEELEKAAQSGSRMGVRRALVEAAEARIEETDLAGVNQFLVPNYGVQQLVHWCKNKFEIEVDGAALIKAVESKGEPPIDTIMAKVREAYASREIEYPVQFQMELTSLLMRQSPQAAASNLVQWANRKLGMNLTEQRLMSTPPAKIREELLAASKNFIESGKLEQAVKDAQGCRSDEELATHLRERHEIEMPDWMRYLQGKEREDAIRGRVEMVLRAELQQFEQQVLLSTLDDTWRSHLYGMDQLRDVINFRAYSQQDPRTEFKREGSRTFQTMLDNVRDRITDDIFKVKLVPSLPPMPPAPRAPEPLSPMGGAGGGMGASLAGGGPRSTGGGSGGGGGASLYYEDPSERRAPQPAAMPSAPPIPGFGSRPAAAAPVGAPLPPPIPGFGSLPVAAAPSSAPLPPPIPGFGSVAAQAAPGGAPLPPPIPGFGSLPAQAAPSGAPLPPPIPGFGSLAGQPASAAGAPSGAPLPPPIPGFGSLPAQAAPALAPSLAPAPAPLPPPVPGFGAMPLVGLQLPRQVPPPEASQVA